ncbi:MAG: hypothetical protein JJ908_15280 [Rhizobiales bacterium]|nr:hypothetical protein [Hyphomicrobiales bacterium]MBO6700104.1 hypothetical protein [Hyphomicrobiales bacterium]MBO6737731.1 hypothetical protein [Hyphomicrobiales bacterium]MBO6913212.1 hypothetical protein [Hyphomicrobiales bacterium]MBO6954256.1 hypothetical protein [Hyphomicrobiales bacterium]
MADDAEEEENYWPGYVDALSTMTMVLTFVMMILVVVVFMLIQNTSQAIIQERVAQANVGGGAGSSQILRMSQSDADATTTATNEGTPPIVTVDEEATQEQNVQSIAVDEEDETRAIEAAEVRDRGAQEAVTISQEGLTVAFADGDSGLDETAMEVVRDFGTNHELAQSDRTLEIIAFAHTLQGNATDVRRVAYYRAMLIRNQLLEAGVPASRISVGVRDVRTPEDGTEVKVFGR